ncbi:MAG: imidazoleglycerol-phosphate dehydratase HisB [Actinomycetota bacterium]|nr:imidazoleglycerol-phosphate dehydratase HisB [Actinomycetota bacterium]
MPDPSVPERAASVERITRETQIRVTLLLDGGDVAIDTGIPFFDHMLDQVARHARFGLQVQARGDLQVDAHHTVEDVGIAFGQALTEALGDKRGVHRYGDALVPMEESLAQVAIDLSGRALLVHDAEIPPVAVGGFDTVLTEEFLQAFARAAGATLHVTLLRSKNAHHAVEAIFKALARALGAAVALDPRAPSAIPSTKGVL